MLAAIASATFAQMPSAYADDFKQDAPSLSYLSVRTDITNPQSGVVIQDPSQAPKQKGLVWSDKQAHLMQDLSRAIDVSGTSVRLCLNIHYSTY